MKKNTNMKKKIIIAFDLDETIGYFTQIGIVYDALQYRLKRNLTKIEMYKLFDLFPNIFRSDIFSIFKFLKKKKQQNKYIKIIIFTNNQAGPLWSLQIKNYINDKLKYILFDAIIGPYKIKNEIIEPQRTSHVKKYDDMKKILNIRDDNKDKILFIDDRYHCGMAHKNIRYILLNPYIYNYDFNYMVDKIIHKQILFDYKKYTMDNIRISLLSYISRYHFSNKDKIIPNKEEKNILFNKIKNFFLFNKKEKTKKKKKYKKNQK